MQRGDDRRPPFRALLGVAGILCFVYFLPGDKKPPEAQKAAEVTPLSDEAQQQVRPAQNLPAAAQPSLPNFDYDRSCKRGVAEHCAKNKCNNNESMFDLCVVEEAIALDNIRGKWDDLSSSIRSYCLQWLGSVENYKALSGCLDREFATRPKNKKSPDQAAQKAVAEKAPEPPSDVDNAYRLCAMFNATKMLSQKCEVSGWNSTVDIAMNLSPREDASVFCAQLPGLLLGKNLAFRPGWQLRVFTPYSGQRPVASCDLHVDTPRYAPTPTPVDSPSDNAPLPPTREPRPGEGFKLTFRRGADPATTTYIYPDMASCVREAQKIRLACVKAD